MTGIDPSQFRQYVIKPTLDYLNLGGDAAEELLLGTVIQESALGHYLHQLGKGPAEGVEEMEPATHDDIWNNYLPKFPPLAMGLRALRIATIEILPADQMVGNLYYAVAMARVLYRRVPEPLPHAGDLAGQAAYYKKNYNSPLGAATVEQYIANWRAAGLPG